MKPGTRLPSAGGIAVQFPKGVLSGFLYFSGLWGFGVEGMGPGSVLQGLGFGDYLGMPVRCVNRPT